MGDPLTFDPSSLHAEGLIANGFVPPAAVMAPADIERFDQVFAAAMVEGDEFLLAEIES